MRSARRQAVEDRERRVKHTDIVSIQKLIDVSLAAGIGIGRVDMAHPQSGTNPGKKGWEGSELKVMHKVEICLMVSFLLELRAPT